MSIVNKCQIKNTNLELKEGPLRITSGKIYIYALFVYVTFLKSTCRLTEICVTKIGLHVVICT